MDRKIYVSFFYIFFKIYIETPGMSCSQFLFSDLKKNGCKILKHYIR